jgi:thiosulfate/3-mercaptopyruvate sulfurtransferase
VSLISTRELARRLDDPALRIVDVRWTLGRPDQGRKAYERDHLPGAIFVDLETDLSDPNGYGAPGRHPLPDPGAFAARLAAAGIGDDHLVVAYDDAAGTIAARLWWMLDDLGHPRVAVLDGGYPAWVADGLPVSTEIRGWPPASLHLRPHWTHVIDRPTLQGRLGSVVLLDARAAERYRGEIEPIDPAAGHIPTARSLPTAATLGPDGRLHAPDVLRTLYPTRDRAAIEPGDPPVVTSCGSGVTACHHALAMRVAGLPTPLLYPGSYSDWTRSGLPVVTGDDPGDPP